MGRKSNDLTNMKFNQLTALFISGKKDRYTLWKCVCDCGNTLDAVGSHLVSNRVRSCGCIHANTRHGANRVGKTHPLYEIWSNMIARCYDKNSTNYHHYGGRGIKVYHIWHVYENFRDYMLALPDCPKNIQVPHAKVDREIDRYPDNNGNYWPGNIRWATRKEQLNNKRNNRVVSYKGKDMTLKEAVDTYSQASYQTVHARITKLGWAISRAIETP